MAGSLWALLDDIAVLAKAAAASVDDIVAGAAKASAKSAGVVIDDAAVTPQYVQGLSPNRELPIIWKITRGSLVNKAIIIVAIMLLSVWAPWVFPWLLLIGGTYLCYEGAEKVWHWIGQLRGKEHEPSVEEVVERTPQDEQSIVRSATTTDLVLSAEIMLISLSNIESDSWGMRLAMLIVIAIAMTALVYGVVALLVKMDDVGLWLTRRGKPWQERIGRVLVGAMPYIFRLLSIVGVVAMLWVGGHIIVANLAEVGVPLFYNLLHDITHAVHGPAIVTWLIDSGLSAVFGLAWGFVVVGVVTVVKKVLGKESAAH